MIEVTVEGLKEIQRNLEKALRHVTDGKLLAKAALMVERQAKINATGQGIHAGGGPNVQTGRLRASIWPTIEQAKPVTWAKVGTNVFYAPFVEFGHGFRNSTKRAPAYPFMRPAADAVKGELEGIVISFGQDMEKEWTSGT